MDLRVSTSKSDNRFYFVHGLYGEEITTHLITVKKFIEEEIEEIIILDFQHFYNFSTNDHERLIALTKSIFGDSICPLPWHINSVRLSWMLDQGFRVIIIYRNNLALGDSMFWPAMRWLTPWPQTTSAQEMIEFLNTTLVRRPRHAGFVSQCLLTPDVKVSWSFIQTSD